MFSGKDDDDDDDDVGGGAAMARVRDTHNALPLYFVLFLFLVFPPPYRCCGCSIFLVVVVVFDRFELKTNVVGV